MPAVTALPETTEAVEEPIGWSVPVGWKAMPAGQMVYAAFAATGDDPPLRVTVIPLPAQPLLPNVNRWEGQLGLPASGEADLGKKVRRIDVAGVAVDVVDLTGPDGQQRLLGAVIPQGERMWFIKMMGPAEKVAGQKENFEGFVRSVRFREKK